MKRFPGMQPYCLLGILLHHLKNVSERQERVKSNLIIHTHYHKHCLICLLCDTDSKWARTRAQKGPDAQGCGGG